MDAKTAYSGNLVQTIGIVIYKRLICEMFLTISKQKRKNMDIYESEDNHAKRRAEALFMANIGQSLHFTNFIMSYALNPGKSA